MWTPINNFLGHLEYSIDGSHHTVLYEGSWTTEDGVTRLRLDCQEFPAFWLSGKLDGGVLAIDGGRFDDTWTLRPVSHTEFVSTPNAVAYVIRFGDVKITVPFPETMPRDVFVLNESNV